MRLLVTVLFVLISLTVFSQEKKKKEKPPVKRSKIERMEEAKKREKILRRASEEDLDRTKSCYIPSSAVWMGEMNPQNFRFVKERMLIYNFWSPLNPKHIEVLSNLEEIKNEFPDIFVIDFLHPKDLELFSAEEAYDLWRKIENKRPLVIGVNDYIMNMGLKREESNVMVTTNRSGELIIDMSVKNNVFESILETYFAGEEYKNPPKLNPQSPNQFHKTSFLSFPQGITADELEPTLYIADTGNNRIVTLSETGMVLNVIGSGAGKLADGVFGSCSFNHPSDIVIDSENRKLYVADEYNHAIREIDLILGTVKTILGTGTKATILEPELHKRDKPIAYPNSLMLKEGQLIIGMGQNNSVYSYDLISGKAVLLVGSGSEESIDGLIKSSSLAKPNALVNYNGELCVLEENTSSIRKVGKKKVETIYSNNPLDSFQLNLPQSLGVLGSNIYVMDTYNHSIRALSEDGKLTHITGSEKGFRDGT